MSRPSFYAEDAFTYVKTYNELITKNAEQISDIKEDFEKKYWDGTAEDYFFFVKMRAFEHALEYKASGKPPEGLVVLGTGNAADEQSWLKQQSENELKIKTLEKDKKELNGEIKKFEAAIQECNEREASLREEIHKRNVALREMKNRKTNLQGVYSMVIAVLFTIIIILSWNKIA